MQLGHWKDHGWVSVYRMCLPEEWRGNCIKTSPYHVCYLVHWRLCGWYFPWVVLMPGCYILHCFLCGQQEVDPSNKVKCVATPTCIPTYVEIATWWYYFPFPGLGLLYFPACVTNRAWEKEPEIHQDFNLGTAATLLIYWPSWFLSLTELPFSQGHLCPIHRSPTTPEG